MTRINTDTTTRTLHKKIHFNKKDADLGNNKDIKKCNEAGPGSSREPDFAELHASFEAHYEQFLTDTSHEIEKRTQRLQELQSFVFGKPGSR